MNKFCLSLMASLLSCSAAIAFWPEAADSSLEVGVGYRRDTLEWKTSSHSSGSSGYDLSGDFPDRFKSHLKWKNINIWEIEANGKYVTCDCLYFRFNADYGWITSGKNRDSDSSGNNYYAESFREFSRSHSKVKGNVYDVRLAVGYQFKFCDDSFSLTPLVGYAWQGQHFRDRDLRHSYVSNDVVLTPAVRSQSSSSSSSDFESFSSSSGSSYGYSGGEHSKYHTRWNGPFIGFDFDYRFGCACEWDVFGTYEFHWTEYHAKGKWNLRQDLHHGGFTHHAKDAYGSIFDIGLKWDFCECWTASIKGEFQWYWADHGRDRSRVAGSGGYKKDASIHLKDVRWDSAAVILDLGMVF